MSPLNFTASGKQGDFPPPRWTQWPYICGWLMRMFKAAIHTDSNTSTHRASWKELSSRLDVHRRAGWR